MSRLHCLSCQHWWTSRGGSVCPKCRSAVIVAESEIIDNPFESTGRVWMTVIAFLGLPVIGVPVLLASPELENSLATGKTIGLWYLWFVVGLAVVFVNRRSFKALRSRCWHKETLPDRARARVFGTRMPPVHIVDADAGEPITAARALDALVQSGTQLLNWVWRDPRATGGSIAVRFTIAGVFLAAWLALMYTRHFTLGLIAVVAGLVMLLAGIAAVRAGQRRRREPWG